MPRSRLPQRQNSADQLKDLMSSAKTGNPETIRHKARQMGRDLNSVYVGGKTLLTKAIEDIESPSTVEAIIKAGADVDCPNSQGKTALMMAVKVRRPELLKVLIEYGADLKLKTTKSISALSLCLTGELYSYFDILLRQSMSSAESMCENIEEICLLIRRKNNKTKETNKSDFFPPILNMDPRLISAIKNVYDVNIKDTNRNTPLMYAVRCYYDDCVRILLLAGADVNRINKSKETALTLAMTRSHNPILKDLIRAGALRRHPRGKTSTLHFGMFKIILDYLQQNGNFNMSDIYGKTALMYAAERGDKASIMYAVEMDIEEFVKSKFLLDDKKASAPCLGDCYDGVSVSSPCAANEHERNCKDSNDQRLEDKSKFQDNNGRPIIMYAFETRQMLLDSYIQSRVSGSSEYRDGDGRTILMNLFKFYKHNSLGIVTQLILNIAQKTFPKYKSSIMSAFQVTYKTIERIFVGKANLRDNCGDSTVIYAIRYCDFLTEEITKLLVGDTHKEQYQDGKTALMIAVSGYNGGSYTYIEPLIGDSCSIQDKDGKTALMYALIHSLVPDDLLKQMIGGSQNVQDKDGKTALMYSIIYKIRLSDEMIELLAGEAPFIQDNVGKTALMYAFECKQYLEYSSIHKLFGAKVDICDIEGDTTLIYALKYYLNLTEEIISLLVGDRTTEKYQNGQTSLMIALQHYNTNKEKYDHHYYRFLPRSEYIAGHFLKPLVGDSCSIQDNDGKTALMYALIKTKGISENILQMMIGDSLNMQDNEGKTALMYAFIHAPWISDNLLKQMIGNSHNVQDNDKKTALMYAFIYEHKLTEKMIELLAGETQLIQDNDGKTALMYAFEYKQRLTYSCIHKLLGAKVDIRDNEGNTNLIYALKYGQNLTEQIISLLGGDKTTEKYQNGQTALMIALQHYNTNLQKYDHHYYRFLHRSEYIAGHFLKPLVGDSCSIQDDDGKTALMYALIKTKGISENILQMMIGDSQNIQDNEGKTALMYAFIEAPWISGNLLKQMIGNSQNVQDNDKKTALMYVFIYGNKLSEEMIALIAGENPFIQDNIGKTALMYALKNQNNLTYTCIQKLFGGKVEIHDNEGKTHLLYALEFYTQINEEIANLLVGDTHKAQYQHGKTALMIALENNIKLHSIHHFIQSLIDLSCDVQDNSGQTALMYAMRHNCRLPEHLFEQMIRQSQFIQDNEGKTALMHASQKPILSNSLIMKLLHRDSLNMQDNEGKTALHHAIEHDQADEYIEKLILHGSSLEVEDKQKRTALDLCLQLDTRDTVSLYEWSKHFFKTKMLLRYNPMPRVGLLGKKGLLQSAQKGTFTLQNFWTNKEIFRLMIVNGIEPFPNLREKKSTFVAVLKLHLINVVKYLIANMYLTNEDLMLLNKAKNYLKSDEYTRNHQMLFNGIFLDLSSPNVKHLITEAASQPWPLVKLSFIVVSSAVGHGTNREDRVNRLPLPNPIKESLMFNTRTALIPVSEWSNIPMVFDPVEYEKTRRPRPLLNYWPFGAELVV